MSQCWNLLFCAVYVNLQVIPTGISTVILEEAVRISEDNDASLKQERLSMFI